MTCRAPHGTDLSDALQYANDDHGDGVADDGERRSDDGQRRCPADSEHQQDLTAELERQNTADERRRYVAVVERRQHDALHRRVPLEMSVTHFLNVCITRQDAGHETERQLNAQTLDFKHL